MVWWWCDGVSMYTLQGWIVRIWPVQGYTFLKFLYNTLDNDINTLIRKNKSQTENIFKKTNFYVFPY